MDEPHDHGVRVVIDGALAVLVGLLAVLQARINAELAVEVGSGVEAAMFSFGSGLVLIAAVVAAVPAARRGVGRLWRAVTSVTRRMPWWTLLGGLGGATFVASQGLAVPVTGVALFTVAVVAGQTGNSLVADRLGVGPGGKRAVTFPRVVAAVMATGGVALAVVGELGTDSSAGWTTALLLGFAMLAGAAVAFQQGLNGRVAVVAGSPLTAAGVNFTVGFAALFVIATAFELVDGAAVTWPPMPWEEPLLWLGGPIGVAFVGVASFAVRGLGVLLFSLLTIVGQLLGSVGLDLLAPVSGGGDLGLHTAAAVVVSILATAVAFVGTRRPAGGTMAR